LIDSAKLWALFVLGLSYVHQATSGFALPAMLPMISPDLHLSDFQGAMLTSGYSYLYALALIPVGLLADRVDRPKLLGVGLALWSSLSMIAAGAGSFRDLLLVRTGFAVAQAAQNPVSFSLIPDLFPANKSTALAAYNCAIYLGRALSFASVLVAHRIGAGRGAEAAAAAVAGAAGPQGEIALSMVPLEKLDLQRMSIIYTAGDMAAVTPVYNYNFNVIAYEAAAGMGGDGWRDMLTFIGYPGFVIAAVLMLSVNDPRKAQALAEGPANPPSKSGAGGGNGLGAWFASAAASVSATSALSSDASVGDSNGQKQGGAAAVAVPSGLMNVAAPLSDWRAGVSNLSQKLPLDMLNRLLGHFSHPTASSTTPSAAADPSSNPAKAPLDDIKSLFLMPAFQTTTIAAALNDLGSYALIAWHSTFYERVYGLDSSVYAPILAVILPVGGIVGGVGGGLIADWLSTVGGRYWLTAGEQIRAKIPDVMCLRQVCRSLA
jgi:MFS family permease